MIFTYKGIDAKGAAIKDQIEAASLEEAKERLKSQGILYKEIEEDMLTGKIDIAVHSMKDMPVAQPGGLVLDCYLPREDVRDAKDRRWLYGQQQRNDAAHAVPGHDHRADAQVAAEIGEQVGLRQVRPAQVGSREIGAA